MIYGKETSVIGGSITFVVIKSFGYIAYSYDGLIVSNGFCLDSFSIISDFSFFKVAICSESSLYLISMLLNNCYICSMTGTCYMIGTCSMTRTLGYNMSIDRLSIDW